jgi:hypothetical protein
VSECLKDRRLRLLCYHAAPQTIVKSCLPGFKLPYHNRQGACLLNRYEGWPNPSAARPVLANYRVSGSGGICPLHLCLLPLFGIGHFAMPRLNTGMHTGGIAPTMSLASFRASCRHDLDCIYGHGDHHLQPDDHCSHKLLACLPGTYLGLLIRKSVDHNTKAIPGARRYQPDILLASE